MDYQWKREPKAEALVTDLLTRSLERHEGLQALQRSLSAETSTRLFDWVDHLVAPESDGLFFALEDAGFVEDSPSIFHHPAAQLPSIRLTRKKEEGVALKVESIADFLMVRGLNRPIEGKLFSAYRRALISEEGGVHFWVVERKGTRSFSTDLEPKPVAEALELWKARPRGSLEAARTLAKELAEKLGTGVAAWVVLEVERAYWQARNRAGQLQKNRQDRLGLGWANHDHHTFRSSRADFAELVALFETLGFHCRERFYAGEEAGWGAQVMENSEAGLVLFLDVDLSAEEIAIDFAHRPLPETDKLGTIGLWCALHGDSILEAGMHHLEAQFEFADLKSDLEKIGIGMMAPFSDFPYLKQAFTKGEIWRVDPARVEALLKRGMIAGQQAETFLKEGALGSHMENLQRREGYKGFNQKNVSDIIRRTDPRAQTSPDSAR
ncbi:MAG: hypothetical protein KDK48_01230 [Chlamydiia bacterium]|nr:hypothetical protein [Chlamydiia bacterium]